MLGTAYLDDSADAMQSEVFVAAGFFCVNDEWRRLRRAWRGILKPYSLSYFRTTDCRNLQGEFLKLKTKFGEDRARTIAAQIRQKLADVMESSRLLMGVGFGINMRDFREVDVLPDARTCKTWMRDFHDYKVAAYRHVFAKIAHTVVCELRDGRYENFIKFYCDDDNRYPKIKRGFERVRKKYPEFGDGMISVDPMDDKHSPELQMADFMADVAREMIGRHIASDGGKAEPLFISRRVLTVDCCHKHSMLRILRGESAPI